MRALCGVGVTRFLWKEMQLRKKYSATGTRARVARVRAEYPNQLDYSGFCAGHETAFKNSTGCCLEEGYGTFRLRWQVN